MTPRKKSPLSGQGSDLERAVETILAQLGFGGSFVREHKFREGKGSRFDFAWVAPKIAIEVEGGEWAGGRHTRGYGFINDIEKYNEAMMLGWRVLRIPGTWVNNGTAADYIQRSLARLITLSAEDDDLAEKITLANEELIRETYRNCPPSTLDV